MNQFILRLLSCALLAAVTVSPAFAAKKKKEPPPPPAPTISSVTADSITISVGGVTKTYGITQFTQVTVKGQMAKLSDLQPGMSVTVVQGTDPTKASRINAGDPPGAPKK